MAIENTVRYSDKDLAAFKALIKEKININIKLKWIMI